MKIYRIGLHVSDLKKAVAFYSKLLGMKGRKIHGARHYFQCGPVILSLLEWKRGTAKAGPIPDCIYLSVKHLKRVHERAKKLRCLSKEMVHDESGADIVLRPWGERSFFAVDPFGYGLCFVDEKTLFTGD